VKNDVIKKSDLHVCIEREACFDRRCRSYARFFVPEWYHPFVSPDPLANRAKSGESTELQISVLSGWPKALWSGLVRTHIIYQDSWGKLLSVWPASENEIRTVECISFLVFRLHRMASPALPHGHALAQMAFIVGCCLLSSGSLGGHYLRERKW